MSGMKCTVERTPLLKALAHVRGVAERRNTIPVLANVLIEAGEDGTLRLTATDMEIALVESVPGARVERPGRATATAATLYEIVNRLPAGAEVGLDHAGGDGPLTLRAGRHRTELAALPAEDFPSMTAGALPHAFALPADRLRRMLDRTRFAISTEETRYYLNGIHLHAAEAEGGAVLRAAATDGHRLARVEEPLPEGAAGMPGVIVPRKAVNELRRLIEGAQGDIAVAVSDTRIRFDIGAVQFTSKLIDGTFPEYERVIPRGNDRVLEVDRRAFAEAAGRVAAISGERSRPVKLSLAAGGLTLSASDAEQGRSQEELDGDVVSYEAGPLEIGFQARYLTDITDQIGDRAVFRFADEAAPVVIQDKDAPEALYVLMPLRL